jgi:glycosyltransferase involved in cell wall biosynthesis
MRITHISIVHAPLDTRIFGKECRALAAAGYDVHLVVGGPPAEQIDGVVLHATAAHGGRPRATRQWARLWRAARWAFRLRPSMYHLHDPHLIPLGILLKLAGSTVVYDVHEDYPAHARTKLVGRPFRGWVKALMWRLLEGLARRTFDRFVCASPALAEQFPRERTVVVGNFPLHRAYEPARPYRERSNTVIYTGNISEIRGFPEMARALELLPEGLDGRLRMVGRCSPAGLVGRVRSRAVGSRMELVPWQPHDVVVQELLDARVGLILLHPLPNHLDAIRSNKLFEYMAAGLPVITSDLPRWREIVRGIDCGLVVDPHDPAAISAAIEYLLTHPEEAEAMGARGRAAVHSQFNWDGEAVRLLALYRELAGDPRPLETGGADPETGRSAVAA